MTYQQLVDHFGGQYKAADALGVSRNMLNRWKNSGEMLGKKIPWQWQCAAAWKTDGELFPTLGPWDKEE